MKRKMINLGGIYIDINAIYKFKKSPTNEKSSIYIWQSGSNKYDTIIAYDDLEKRDSDFNILINLFDIVNENTISSFEEFKS